MLKVRTLGTVLCLGALTALPACSMFGGGGDNGSAGQYRQSSSNTAPQAGANTTGEAAITPGTIRDVQGRLKEANLYRGQVDGVWGPMTQRGVRDWQQQHNMNASGQLDMATLQAMNVSTNDNQYGQNGRTDQPNTSQSSNDQANPNQTNYSTAGTRPTGNDYSNTTPDRTNTPSTAQPAVAPTVAPTAAPTTTSQPQPTH